MADMSSWDRLAHWTSSTLSNLVGTGQGTGTVFGPPAGGTWADWRNPDNWAEPVSYTHLTLPTILLV